MGKFYPKIVIGKDGQRWWQFNRYTFERIISEVSDSTLDKIPAPKKNQGKSNGQKIK